MDIKNIPSVTGVYLFVQKGRPIYIGKSVNLKARVLSHLEDSKVNPKEALIFKNADKVEYIPLESDFKAIILESKLIRIHLPRYNVRWRDDKSFLYIKITVKDRYPKILLARKERDKKSLYFGPFQSTRVTENLLRDIRRIFPYCQQKKITKSPCFYSKIGLCNPCPSKIEKIEDQKEKKDAIRVYRKNIRGVIKALQGKTDLVLEELKKKMEKFIEEENYESALQIRNKVQLFERMIYQAKEGDFTGSNDSSIKLLELKKLLEPYFTDISIGRIECFDISNLSFREGTASLVVLLNGILDKSQYRKFKVKTPNLRSDFEMLGEIIFRRFKNRWKEPDLIVVDGGKPQVRVILSALKKIEKDIPVIGLAKNPDRVIIGQGTLPTIRPNLNNSGFNLIRLLRDESHRFAKKYHLYLREKKIFEPL